MFTINKNIVKTYEIKKSKFITLLYKVDNLDEINNILDKVKKEYKGASHYCYSYILDNNIRYSDDKEPSGTAGMPIYNVLKNTDLNHILCIVVRYFGGIKLGASLLTRTYSNVVKNSIENLIPLTKYINIIIKFKFEDENNINKLDFKLNNKSYNDYIIYDINIKYEDLDIFKNNKYILELIEKDIKY